VTEEDDVASYSRCGCQTECPCVLVGGKGIEITGTGNVDDPYIISTDGTIDCTLVTNCVCNAIAPDRGLECANGQIRVKLSGQSSNLSFGPDGGLLSSCDCTPPNPDAGCCGPDVNALKAKAAAGGQLIWGTMQGSRALVPYGTMRSWDYAGAVIPEINADWTKGMSGCSAVIAPYPTFKSGWTAESIEKSAENAEEGSVGMGIDYSNLNPAQWMNFTKHVEEYYDTGFENRNADGGLLMSKALSQYRCRWVKAWFIYARTTYNGVITTINRWCDQRWSIIFHWQVSRLADAQAAGISTGVLVSAPAEGGDPSADFPWQNNFSAQLVEDIKNGAGSAAPPDWVAASMRLTDAQLTALVGTGKPVLVFDTGRKSDVARIKRLGIKGVLSDDMVYQKSGDPEATAAEGNCLTHLERDTWSVGSGMHGQFWAPQNTGLFKNKRGYQKVNTSDTNISDLKNYQIGCWHLPSNFGNIPGEDPINPISPGLLMGAMCDNSEMTETGAYQISFHAGWVTAANSDWEKYGYDSPGDPTNETPKDEPCKIGMFVCAPDDRNITGVTSRPGPNKPQAPAEGYHCFVRTLTGELVIGKRDSVGTGYHEIASTAGSGPLAGDTLYAFYCRVTPDAVTFAIYRGSAYQTVTTDDKQFRGTNFFITKEELDGTNFEARFANVRLASRAV
jgi:hypothetical protein